ncbi:hypothetical protein T03_4007 [Trichinella britovi]|uniref:Uncharacterized protein n=1 Tax=Trichinella britovi TaxID=45882 RepID=A0A0V1B265_TRIBR|nr:hypothetical protein T03_4007 [Trichinella britovi]
MVWSPFPEVLRTAQRLGWVRSDPEERADSVIAGGIRPTPLGIFARCPPPGRPRGGAGTTSSPADLPPAQVPPSLHRNTAS